MTIEVEQIKKLIEDYHRSENVLIQSGKGPVAGAAALVWRRAIEDLESLLPRKSMADIESEYWDIYVGSWAENDGAKRVIVDVNTESSESPIVLFGPRERASYVAAPNHVFPLDEIPPVWDEEGNPI